MSAAVYCADLSFSSTQFDTLEFTLDRDLRLTFLSSHFQPPCADLSNGQRGLGRPLAVGALAGGIMGRLTRVVASVRF